MSFHMIDKENWKRKEYFDHYLSDVPCTYSMTVNLDITMLLKTLKAHGYKLYPAMIYGISLLVNRHEEFRMSIDRTGNLGYHDEVHPSYTIFHQDDESFSSIWTAYSPDFETFYQRYSEDMKQFGDRKGMEGKPSEGKPVFTISCIPWANFTSFQLNLQNGYDYLPPIFTLGQYRTENDRILIPLAVQVHHAVCDGFHTARFTNELQDWINTFML